MQVRLHKPQNELRQTTLPGEDAANNTSATADHRNVVVSHGIHRGRFPVGGMSVAAARRILGPLINIDNEAVAVINGAPVEEETIIDEHITMLSFVKPSSIRG
jgi:hypothetical protein